MERGGSMSNLSVNTITNATGGNTAQINGMTPTAQSLQGFRNRIINGGMVIDQRNAGALFSAPSNGYTLDRWAALDSSPTSYSVQQNSGAVTPPAGFTNYLGVVITTARTPGAGQRWSIIQNIEGFNVSDLGWGTASAQTVTLSFWVRSSVTGNFGGAIRNSAGTRGYPFNATINAANTWEQKTVTIPGDTTGTWLTNNGVGLSVVFNLGAGSTISAAAGAWAAGDFWAPTGATSVVSTSGATFYITGVQLEAGSVATPFERRDYGRELMMCQRYYYKALVPMGATLNNALTYNMIIALPVSMRATPTLDAGASFIPNTGSAGTPALSVGTGYVPSPSLNARMVSNSASNWTVGSPVVLNGGFNSEL
jgi:hypothetical protein